MRKKSRKRVPQDIRPWTRIKDVNYEVLALPGRKNSRWVAGGRKDWDTRVLNTTGTHEVSAIILKSLRNSLSTSGLNFKQLLIEKIGNCRHGNKTTCLSRYKNFCVFSGRSRTYNRSLYVARHNMRKLVGVGLISGLLK